MTLRLATWNVNSVLARLPRLLAWLEQAEPDVVCLQETKCPDDAFPSLPLLAIGYDSVSYGMGRWNGVALLSRVGLDDVRRGLDDEPAYGEPPALEARAVAATCGPLRVRSVYVPNGRTVGSDHYSYKLSWLRALRDTTVRELAADRPHVVCGDVNVAPTDADVWDASLFATSTHVTEPERAALRELQATGLSDVFPRALKNPHPFTYWDYRAGAFPKDWGMRIDLVLADTRAAAAVTDAFVDREARKGKGSSDHAPVVVDLDL